MKRCDQCASVTIQGIFCHERGCPNTHKVYDPEEERWVTPVQYDDDDLEFLEYDPEED